MIDYLNLTPAQEKLVFQATVWDNPYIPKDHLPFPKQMKALLDFRKELLYGGASAGGKLQKNSTKVVTPNGLVELGSLNKLDKISNPDGTISEISEIFEMGENDIYEIEFADGSVTNAGLDHLWLVHNNREWRNGNDHIITTKELKNQVDKAIIQTLSGKNSCGYPYIQTTSPIEFYNNSSPNIDPYILGQLVGDGCITQSIKITTCDQFTIDYFVNWIKNIGYTYRIKSKRNAHDVFITNCKSLKQELININLMGKHAIDKFIPDTVKFSSIEYRFSFMQGLMDSDASVNIKREQSCACTYTTTSKQLSEDVRWVALSLGYKATIYTRDMSKRRYFGEKVNWNQEYNVTIVGDDVYKLFRIPRKHDLAKKYNSYTTIANYRKVVRIEKIGREPCRCIHVKNPNGLYLVDDFIVTHNSDYLLMAALQFVTVPGYNAIVFRRSYSDLSLPDGLIPRSHEWLQSTDAKYYNDLHQWKFPSGATLTFGYLESENDIYRYKSSAYTFIGYEEVTEFPNERFYTYLFSRMRRLSTASVPLRMRCTTNPDGPGADWVYNRFLPESPQPTSPDRSFIQSKLTDNPHIDQEGYLASLDELDPVTKIQLRDGAWKVKKAGNKFKQEWFDRSWINYEDIPKEGIVVRYWDLASTEEKKKGSKTTDPDYTSGTRVRLHQNTYYIEDIRRGRFNPGTLEEFVQETAEFDGPETIIFIEQEPGATGKIVVDDYIRRVLNGYATFGDRPTGSKEIRANVFSAALYNGNVRIARADWNKQFVTECLLFPTKGVHDDQCFIKGTKISTIFGDKNIEDIKVGDILITPGGTSTVTWSGKTGQHFVIENKNLTGTPHHKIFDKEKGFIPLITHDVSSRVDTICVANQIRWIARKLWYSMEQNTDSWARKDIISANQLPMKEENVLKDCMLPFTSFIRAKKYQKVMLFIIKMVIHSTIQLGILSVWKESNIVNSINVTIQKNKQNILAKLDLSLKHGTLRKKAEHGTANTPKVQKKKSLFVTALSVIKNLNLLEVLQNIAVTNVQTNSDGSEEKLVDITKNEKHDVYNLTTEPSHTFYANHILVSNCDSTSGAISKLPRVKKWKNGDIGSVETINPIGYESDTSENIETLLEAMG